jgi:hypothetical protein
MNVVSYLLNNSADFNILTTQRLNSFHMACGNLEMFKFLYYYAKKNKFDVEKMLNSSDNDVEFSVFGISIYQNNVEVFEFLLELGFDINTNISMKPCLTIAVERGSIDVVKSILKYDKFDKSIFKLNCNNNPLNAICYGNRVSTVLVNGEEIAAPSSCSTLEDVCCHCLMLDLFKERKLYDPKKTPLMKEACLNNHIQIMKKIHKEESFNEDILTSCMSKNISVESVNFMLNIVKDKKKAMNYAFQALIGNNAPDITYHLFKEKFDPNSVLDIEKMRMDAFSCFFMRNQFVVLDQFFEFGLDVNKSFIMHPLMIAGRKKDIKSVIYLLEKKFDPKFVDKDQATIFNYFMDNHESFVEILSVLQRINYSKDSLQTALNRNIQGHPTIRLLKPETFRVVQKFMNGEMIESHFQSKPLETKTEKPKQDLKPPDVIKWDENMKVDENLSQGDRIWESWFKENHKNDDIFPLNWRSLSNEALIEALKNTISILDSNSLSLKSNAVVFLGNFLITSKFHYILLDLGIVESLSKHLNDSGDIPAHVTIAFGNVGSTPR